MTMLVRKGGTWQTISAGKVFKGGAWRDLVQIQVYRGGAWRVVANFTPPGTGGGGGGAMTLTAAPTSASRISRSSISTSGTFTATPSGGLTPITYSWTVVSQDAGPTFTIDSPTLASTTITASALPALGTAYSITIHCTATDSLGVVATSNTVTATFTQIDTGGNL